MKIIFKILVLAMLIVCSSCVTNKTNTLLQTDERLPQYEKAPYEYYKICPNDWLVMRVFTLNKESSEIFNESTSNTSSFSGSQVGYRVYDDGTIDIPFISNIPVAGLTIREASRVVEQKIKEYVPDACVKLALANDQFYVLGEAATGSFSLYKEKLNIFQAIALAGSINENGDKSRVTIIRNNPSGGRPIVKQFDLRSASIIDSEYYYIKPNDVIYIPSIKGDFFKVTDFSSTMTSITTSLNFLITVVNFGFTYVW